MRSTCAAVPARPTASSRASVSGVATRVRARTLAYDSSPRASASASSGSVAQGARDADALAGGAEVEADAPAQPVGAGAEAVAPAAAGVELADEVEQAGGGGVEVRGQLGDLVAQPVQLRDGSGVVRMRGESLSMVSLPSDGATLHPGFGALWSAQDGRFRDAQ